MADLIPFQYGEHSIRVQVDDQGNPWWIAKDVCDTLGLTNPSEAMTRLNPSESTIITFTEDGIPHRLLLINEPGLYRLIFRSNKPEAKHFQDWVFGEVLPAIRQTGQYAGATSPVLPTPAPSAHLALIDQCYALLSKLGQLTARDTLMLADQARNVMQSGQRLLPSADPAHPARTVYGFSVAERLEQLGYQLSRKQQAALAPQLGKRVIEEWRSRYPSEPEKETRWVDGAQRQVAWYPHDDAAWIDVIIQSYLAQFPGITRTQSLI